MKTKSYIGITAWLIALTVLELMLFSHQELGDWRVWGLLSLAASKMLAVVLVYMNLNKEGWGLKLMFFAPIPVAIYFLLFMVYDAAYLWRS